MGRTALAVDANPKQKKRYQDKGSRKNLLNSYIESFESSSKGENLFD
jgi:hypothetical protein